jgi:uncharacterized protein (DUF697 family)
MRRAARVDTTAKDLVKCARQLGCVVLPVNGVVDALVWHRGQTFAIDWKSKGGTLTPAQAKLVAQGAKIYFVSTQQQLMDVLGAREGDFGFR